MRRKRRNTEEIRRKNDGKEREEKRKERLGQE